MVVKIKFIKGKNFNKNLEVQNQKFGIKIWTKSWHLKSGKIDKNRENNYNFMVYGNQKSDGQLLR